MKVNMKTIWKSTGWEKRVIFLLSLLCAGILTGILSWRMDVVTSKRLQEHLADEVLRFHVLANSDSDEDQNLKLQVRDAVLQYLSEVMPQDSDVEEVKMWAREHTREIEEVSMQVIENSHFDYPVNAAVTTAYFPEKTYGEVVFPAGNYEALRIEIGAAKGHNWWCVLYPSVCIQDATNAVFPDGSKEKLSHVLTEEEYSQVTATSEFKAKFYFWEKWK